MKKHDAKNTVIVHLHNYEDGNGDLYNLAQFLQYIDQCVGIDKIDPIVVMASHNVLQLSTRFENTVKTAIPAGNIYYISTSLPNNLRRDFDEWFYFSPNHASKFLTIYSKASFIYNIATPFLPDGLPSYIKTTAKIITITEHAASSFISARTSRFLYSRPQFGHYVTGIISDQGEGRFSGLMVKDLSVQDHAATLLSISDKSYLTELGLRDNATLEEASAFLNATIIVPIYINKIQVDMLLPIIKCIKQLDLTAQYSTIVFHLNIGLTERERTEANNSVGSPALKFVLHYLKEDADYAKLCQVASKGGITVCSADKTLELHISAGSLPLYLPVPWKIDMQKSLAMYAKSKGMNGYAELLDKLRVLGRIGAKPSDADLSNAKISKQDLELWRSECISQLLKESFYNIAALEILPDKDIDKKLSAFKKVNDLLHNCLKTGHSNKITQTIKEIEVVAGQSFSSLSMYYNSLGAGYKKLMGILDEEAEIAAPLIEWRKAVQQLDQAYQLSL